jgi:sugar lactone lactonase YvrE
MSWQPPDGTIVRRHVANVAAAIWPRRAGGLVVATERGFALLKADFDGVTPLVDAFDDPSVRMNAGGCDPQGRFYCGSMAYDFAPRRASLYQLDADHGVRVILRGVTISNGLVWSLEGSTVYYIDTPTQRVDAFDFDAAEGTLSNRRTVVEIPKSDGEPDGMTIDTEGSLWVAMWGGAAVHPTRHRATSTRWSTCRFRRSRLAPSAGRASTSSTSPHHVEDPASVSHRRARSS